MRPEYQALTFMTVFFLLAWFPASLGKIKTFGGKWAASNREPVIGKELPQWAQRCERAYNNLKDYFPGFVVAIVLLGLTDRFTSATETVAYIYVLGRIVHFIAYGLGNVPFRAIGFFTGMGTNLYLLYSLF